MHQLSMTLARRTCVYCRGKTVHAAIFSGVAVSPISESC